MGTYTVFKFDATLKKDAPAEVLEFIRERLTRTESEMESDPLDEHPFFLCARWDWVLTWYNCNEHGFNSFCKDTEDGLVIHIDTELKNYCNSVQWFLVWIAPLVNLDHACKMSEVVEGVDEEPTDCSELIARIQQRVELAEKVDSVYLYLK